MRDEKTFSYLGGFFDGEGCVTLSKNGSIALGIVNTHLGILKLFQNVFGGSVIPRKQIWNKPQYVWRVYGEEAVSASKILVNFTIEKAPQLVEVISWMALRNQFSATRIPGTKGSISHPERAKTIKEIQQKLTKMKKEAQID